MALYTLLMCVPLLGMLCWAAAEDLRSRRIPNWLTLAMVVTGLMQSVFNHSPLSFSQALTGLLVGFGATLVFLMLGAMGGGDVKMMAGVGAWLGATRCLEVLVVAAVVAMLLAVFQAARQGQLTALFRNALALVGQLANPRSLIESTSPRHRPVFVTISKPLPYAVPVLAATVMVLGSGVWVGG